jgi:hypothetical protein
MPSIAWLLLPLLRLLWPPVGQHRSPESRQPVAPHVPALSGEAIGIVRPYLVAHEWRQRAGANG